MKYEALLTFNSGGAYAELGKTFDTVIQDLCDTVLANAGANLKGMYPEVEATLQSRMLSLAQSGLVDGQIGSEHWQSWLAEWGSGSDMDTANPDLMEYMGSEFWNPLRDGLAITGRPKDPNPYIGIDGLEHSLHTGKLAGRNLEELSQYSWFQEWMQKVGLPDDSFQPKVPLHFMHDALESNRDLILNQLNAVLETFGFGDFFM